MVATIVCIIIDLILLIGDLIYIGMVSKQGKAIRNGYVRLKEEYKRELKTIIAEAIIIVACISGAIYLLNQLQVATGSTAYLFLSIAILLILISCFFITLMYDEYKYGTYDMKGYYIELERLNRK